MRAALARPLVILLPLSLACALGCARTNASSGNDPLGPGESSADTVLAHTFFPEHRDAPSDIQRQLHVSDGFSVGVAATGLAGARMIAVGDDGTVYVTRPVQGEVAMLKPGAPPAAALRGLPGVHGIAIHEGRVYLATTKEVAVADIRSDGTFGDRRVIISNLPDGGQHAHRTIAVGPDGMLYISVGSDCNACPEPDGEHATLLRAPLDGGARDVFAKGLRNTIGFDWAPSTQELWGMDNGIDFIGDDDPPEELNHIVEGGDYGWPFRFGENRVNRLFGRASASRSDFEKPTAPPALTLAAHSAPIAMVFHNGMGMPAGYAGSAFVALHGSWNRASAEGYKVVRIVFSNGRPERVEDFVTGFLVNGGKAYIGRPAGLAIAKDGALLVSDDSNGVIFRVAYAGANKS
jgi:glucose/arabinose dehydrogenase